MSHDWRTAFLEQAASDYRVFKKLRQLPGVEQCHAAHYLQMMSEKAAKSMLTTGADRPPADHHAVLRLLRMAKQDPGMRKRAAGSDKAYYQAVDGLMGFAERIARLAPTATADSPNPEYPWQPAGTADVRVPCQSAIPELAPPNAPLLKKFLRLFEIYFDRHGVAIK